jgi:hypothetical protein
LKLLQAVVVLSVVIVIHAGRLSGSTGATSLKEEAIVVEIATDQRQSDLGMLLLHVKMVLGIRSSRKKVLKNLFKNDQFWKFKLTE